MQIYFLITIMKLDENCIILNLKGIMRKWNLTVGLKIQKLILFSVEFVVTERSCSFFSEMHLQNNASLCF
jgi:hypothetical protein